VIEVYVRRIVIAAAVIMIGTTILVGGDPRDSKMSQEGRHEIHPIAIQAPEKMETATFALGCFWGPDGLFGILPGVIRTRVGYAGGTGESPTYHHIDGHAETIQIDFDPSVISYQDLLEVFWASHNSFSSPISGQYRSMIFVHDGAQRDAAGASLELLVAEKGRSPTTQIVSFEGFTRAEDYHQKYRLQGVSILAEELKERFDSLAEFTDSTVVARINGYVSGRGSSKRLEEEIDSFGLSEPAAAALRRIVD